MDDFDVYFDPDDKLNPLDVVAVIQANLAQRPGQQSNTAPAPSGGAAATVAAATGTAARPQQTKSLLPRRPLLQNCGKKDTAPPVTGPAAALLLPLLFEPRAVASATTVGANSGGRGAARGSR